MKKTRIKPIDPPDYHHLMAAEGWIGLGVDHEAEVELEKIAPEFRDHPDVLEVRWEIYARAKKWDAALEIAKTLVLLVPDEANHWIQRSYALHELDATPEACQLLLPVTKRFPDNAVIRYNLACYECQLGHLTEAKRWLAESFALNKSKKAKLEALRDPDLEPLWKHLGEL